MIDLEILHKRTLLSPLDLHFAGFMERLSGAPRPELALAAALVSRVTREGHVCFDLSRQGLGPDDGGAQDIVLPERGWWADRLRQSGVVGDPGEVKPLVLDRKGRLYLYRYWEYQDELARAVKERLGENPAEAERQVLRRGVAEVFPESGCDGVDWQKVAAVAAARRRFCVVSGGPGTGKTTTVARILALLARQHSGARIRTALVSPTGKGAARLQEAMKKAKESLPFGEDVKALLPDEASTIHRLLGAVRGSPYFRFDKHRRLPVDALVVDEASMVDLALMSKLAQALPPASRFILLGDKDQLSSVEAGAVLGDICDSARVHPFSDAFCREIREICGYRLEGGGAAPVLSDSIVRLSRSYRFDERSGIASLSRAVNEGDADGALQTLQHEGHVDLSWSPLPSRDSLSSVLKDRAAAFHGLFLGSDPRDLLRVLDRFRILCALREGPFGARAVNRLIERIFREQRFIRGEGPWYRGRPVLVTRNDYSLHLYNGDVGIALPDPGAGGALRVFFQAPDGALRAVHPVRLPEHETVYALTVHKSQGSEFDRVLFVLPDRDAPVLTRELIYTAITRARERVEVWGGNEVFRAAVSRSTFRLSGLRDALWED